MCVVYLHKGPKERVLTIIVIRLKILLGWRATVDPTEISLPAYQRCQPDKIMLASWWPNISRLAVCYQVSYLTPHFKQSFLLTDSDEDLYK